jgi:hypothetical protein
MKVTALKHLDSRLLNNFLHVHGDASASGVFSAARAAERLVIKPATRAAISAPPLPFEPAARTFISLKIRVRFTIYF